LFYYILLIPFTIFIYFYFYNLKYFKQNVIVINFLELLWLGFLIFLSMSRVFVGNLSYQTTAPVLGKLFETIGDVVNATIASQFGRSKGFGFVELKDEAAAKEAVEKLNSRELDGRFLNEKNFTFL
jgi:hypothetical protein